MSSQVKAGYRGKSKQNHFSLPFIPQEYRQSEVLSVAGNTCVPARGRQTRRGPSSAHLTPQSLYRVLSTPVLRWTHFFETAIGEEACS
jgi:hypothetical protein